MIPRYQRILFWSLAALTLLLAAFTIHERQNARQRIAASAGPTPYIQPVDAQSEPVTLLLANDADGTLISALREAALPQEPSLRARALIERLITEYSLPGSNHPLKPDPAVEDVFLLKPPTSGAPNPKQVGTSGSADETITPDGLLAVVNLRSTFADAHPSSIRGEDLTLQSIIGTLHANIPQINQIRFLVDGQPRDTLAGHADLLRTYSATDTSIQHTQPVETAEP